LRLTGRNQGPLKPTHPFSTSLLLILCLLVTASSVAQLPDIQWANKYGGSAVDIAQRIILTADGGTALAGYTSSKDGIVPTQPSRDYWDLLVVKLSSCGELQWAKSFGGTGYESAKDILQTADGGFLVLGETNSTDGDVTSGYGGTKDVWLLKLDASGNLQWQKRYGGSQMDIGNRIVTLPDGNYMLLCSTASHDGNFPGNRSASGFTDGGLIKVDPNGQVLWTRCYGGSRNDELFAGAVVGNRMYLTGYANSVDGDIPPSQKNYDVWLLCLDLTGNKMYSKIFGGSQNDVAYVMAAKQDTLTLAGYTTSTDAPVSGAHGAQDGWVFQCSTDGKLIWQNTLGGSEADYIYDIYPMANGSFLLAGATSSPDGTIAGYKESSDFWVSMVDRDGKLTWTRNYGGEAAENCFSVAVNESLQEYYLAGYTESGDDDFNASWPQQTDIGLIKLKMPLLQNKDSIVCDPAQFVSYTDTLQDACGYDSLIVTYHGVRNDSLFTASNRADTIFVGDVYNMPEIQKGMYWIPAAGLSCDHCAVVQASPTETTVYTAVLPLDQCEIRDQFTLVVLKDASVFVPNAFTPNGDGKNDRFGPLGKVPGKYDLRVFNRFGEMVFQSNNIEQRWDGTKRGQPEPSGSFSYVLEYLDIYQVKQTKKGNLLLIR